MGKASHQTRIAWELNNIERAHNGVLKPEDIIEFARDPKTALHKEFEWDVEKAAYQHLLAQARRIIQVRVTFIDSPVEPARRIKVREHVSPRVNRGQGYIRREAVMDDPALRTDRLRETIQRLLAIKELEEFPELQSIRNAVREAADKHLPDWAKAAA